MKVFLIDFKEIVLSYGLIDIGIALVMALIVGFIIVAATNKPITNTRNDRL